MPILLIFILVPVIELVVLLKVGSYIGILWTIIFILLTAVVGVHLLRQQGLATLVRAGERMQQGQIPATELAEGFLLALAGALLLTPGFLTDGVGFCLLAPPIRSHLVARVLKMMAVRGTNTVFEHSEIRSGPFTGEYGARTSSSQRNDDQGVIIDGEFERTDKK